MRIYHRTSARFAKRILAGGFRDRTGYYGFASRKRGVWFADIPLDINEGADGDTVFELSVPIRVLREYELIEDDKPYREFRVPAAIVNAYERKVLSEDQVWRRRYGHQA